MPIYTWECPECKKEFDLICSIDRRNKIMLCPECDNISHRIISASGAFCANEDTEWIRSVIEVVDKDSKAPHVVEFCKNPTRTNYQRWMKGEGLRHLEPGEPMRPAEDKGRMKRTVDYMAKKRMERGAITVRG